MDDGEDGSFSSCDDDAVLRRWRKKRERDRELERELEAAGLLRDPPLVEVAKAMQREDVQLAVYIESLEEVVKELRENAALLRERGSERTARSYERKAEKNEERLSEARAALRSFEEGG